MSEKYIITDYQAKQLADVIREKTKTNDSMDIFDMINKINYIDMLPRHNDLKEYSAYELAIVSSDIAKKGKNSSKYNEFHQYLIDDKKWSVTLKNGNVCDCRIIGLCHDVDYNGNALGITMQFTTNINGFMFNAEPFKYNGSGYNPDYKWEHSRAYYAMCVTTDVDDGVTGYINRLIPYELSSSLSSMRKKYFYNNINQNAYGEPVPSIDTSYCRFALLSLSELCGNINHGDGYEEADKLINLEGQQYEYYKLSGTTIDYGRPNIDSWLRTYFPQIYGTNYRNPCYTMASMSASWDEHGVCPCFAFKRFY